MAYLSIHDDGPVRVIRIARDERLNALNLALVDELVAALEAADTETQVRAIVVTGGDKAFAAGADIAEMADATAVDMKLRDQFRAWDRIRGVHKPVIAAVRGFALGGGCELALACDLVIASESAKFGQPEVKLGLMPGAGGTQWLARRLGKARALELLWLGEPITAQEAMALGLVNRVVPDEACVAEAVELGKRLAEMPPVALRCIKEAVYQAMDTALADGLEAERNLFYLLFATEDAREGMRAFMERRTPAFRGR
ncbi:enoyl-CoA hydratase/isomerase family protein [Alicyclobacillus mali]|uniref:Enoyl-CoA hydratase/isomerase family protein n=1 Tax=Alicyclobacillus mali (ex Roth et al. 2021) TaxID=1123961 RepID=A0ABS0F302_9BACL|nr:enoyl-CoA hydratase-related protein [Alicyclobacillus mali (ex Roth et al. 2021)]MBF8377673.1 enoyl-CoA hydratase/isomerase family protein [Alicyclobacillus mali (ex Roth et al. 2021)]MCL6489603.1 enoyl-CoA hydratase/isomerase family protein [Alicyclobacillus mali (ex Roth et al. 2021)]